MFTTLRQITVSAAALLLLLSTQVYADDNKRPLPEPLTLEYALTLIDDAHPNLLQAMAGIKSAESDVLYADTNNELEVFARAELGYVEPVATSPNQDNNDSQAAIIARKTLYDFGRSAALENAASYELASQQILLTDVKQQQRIAIMRRYFDVILADLMFYRYNEEMATEYVSLDRLRARLQLGRASEFDVTQKEVSYNRVRHLRFDSQNKQRIARARLALALNRPGDLPTTVAKPVIKDLKHKLPDVENLQQFALSHNNRILALQKKLVAAQARVDGAKVSDNPRLRGEVGAYEYNREFGSRDTFRAGIILEVPLFGGNHTDANVAKAKAGIFKTQAELIAMEASVQQSILEQWLILDGLLSKIDEMKSLVDYREMYLDRSRTLYEQEMTTDLGDAMVRTSEAEHAYLTAAYSVLLGWEKLAALAGTTVDDLHKIASTQPATDANPGL